MKKIAFDLYGCKNKHLDNFLEMYSFNEKIIKEFKVKPVYKPIIIPYFYGKIKEDEGISCLNIFENSKGGVLGFFTLHTFSQRNIAYFDSFSKEEILNERKKFAKFMKDELLAEEVLYLWPERSDVWLNGGEDIQEVMVDLLKKISKYDKVIIGVKDIKKFKEKNLKFTKNIQIEHIPYNDAWFGDTGPIIYIQSK